MSDPKGARDGPLKVKEDIDKIIYEIYFLFDTLRSKNVQTYNTLRQPVRKYIY